MNLSVKLLSHLKPEREGFYRNHTCLSKPDSSEGPTNSCLSGSSYKGWPVCSGCLLDDRHGNLKVCLYRAHGRLAQQWVRARVSADHALSVCPSFPCWCQMANTTNFVFSAHNAFSILTASLTSTKALFLYICPPPLSACLSHPHPLPDHKEEFQDFQSLKAVKFVSGTCSNALGS